MSLLAKMFRSMTTYAAHFGQVDLWTGHWCTLWTCTVFTDRRDMELRRAPHEIISKSDYLSPVKRRDIGLDLSVCLSVCPSVRPSVSPRGWVSCRHHIAINGRTYKFSPYSIQTRIIDVQRQDFSLIDAKLSELQLS